MDPEQDELEEIAAALAPAAAAVPDRQLLSRIRRVRREAALVNHPQDTLLMRLHPHTAELWVASLLHPDSRSWNFTHSRPFEGGETVYCGQRIVLDKTVPRGRTPVACDWQVEVGPDAVGGLNHPLAWAVAEGQWPFSGRVNSEILTVVPGPTDSLVVKAFRWPVAPAGKPILRCTWQGSAG